MNLCETVVGYYSNSISVDCSPRHSCWDNRKSRQAFEKKLRCYEVSVVSGEVAPVFERDA